MQVSARNVFAGTLTAVICGAVNAEVELTTVGGDVLVAVVTANSVQALGLAVGVSAVAYVKAPLVMLLRMQTRQWWWLPLVSSLDVMQIHGHVMTDSKRALRVAPLPS